MTEPNGKTNGAGSHLDWLRTRHAAITADRHLDMDVPGYEGRLVIRYGPVPWAAITRMQSLLDRPDKDGRGMLAAQADMLIAACREVLVRADEDAELVSVDPSGEKRRFDPKLAELFGLEASTARATIEWLFPNEIALAVQAGEVLDWTRSNAVDTDALVAGE